MPGRPPEVDHVKKTFLKSVESARKLFLAVQSVSGINPNSACPRLHTEQARRVIELAFLGLVSNWEEFLEQSFVRYMAGAKAKNGYAPKLRLGKASDIAHAYHVVSGDSKFDPTKNYSKFGAPKWVIDSARIYFDSGSPYAPRMQAYIEPLESAVKIRNRVAHNSEKCREDFKKVARTHLGLQPNAKLTQGYSAGDLLMQAPVAIFNQKIKDKFDSYFETYCGLFTYLANQIVPKR